MVLDNYHRVYSTGNMAILHHPIRINLLDLINQGIETVPDMSSILNIPRSNLYHHLSILEKEGFVEGYFLNDRIKKFRMKDNEMKLVIEPEDLEDEKKEDIPSDYLSESNTLIVQRPNKDDKNQKKYMEKGRGLFVVGSKEFGMPNLVFHGGLNVSDFDDNYVFGFLGMNYTLEDQVSFIFEYDNFFHSNDPSRFNIGTRFYVTPYFQIDLALREIGKSTTFSNGAKRKSERIVQMSYTTSF